MIPLTTKLPAICSLLRRVLEMEENPQLGPNWRANDQHGHSIVWDGLGGAVVPATRKHSVDFIALTRNITKPMAKALLADIAAWQAVIATMEGEKWYHGRPSPDGIAQHRLQYIADAFPDALFPKLLKP